MTEFSKSSRIKKINNMPKDGRKQILRVTHMETAQGNNLPRIKITNQAAIRRMVYHYGPTTRGVVAERLSLTMPTITTNVNSMISGNIIREVGFAEDAGAMGRRVKLIDIVPDSRYFLGVEMRGTLRSLCVTDYRGGIVYTKLDDRPFHQYDENVRHTGEIILEALSCCGIPKERIMGIGVCLPGLVDSEKGILVKHPGYNWVEKNVARDVRQLTGFTGPILVENNACARAFAAQLFRREMLNEVPSFAYMFISAGIACPLIYNFIPDYGVLVGQGEAGHMILDPAGPKCSCGNYGCLEAFASDGTVIRRCEDAMRMGEAPILRRLCQDDESVTIGKVVEAQELGETGISHIVNTAIRSLGVAIANIENFAHPHKMLIEGGLFTREENKQKLLEVVYRSLYTATNMETSFEFITPDIFSGAIGGAAVAIRNDLETYIE